MSVYHPNPRVAYKSNVKLLNKYQLLHKKEMELLRAQKMGLSSQYQDRLEDVIAAIQQTLSK